MRLRKIGATLLGSGFLYACLDPRIGYALSYIFLTEVYKGIDFVYHNPTISGLALAEAGIAIYLCKHPHHFTKIYDAIKGNQKIN